MRVCRDGAFTTLKMHTNVITAVLFAATLAPGCATRRTNACSASDEIPRFLPLGLEYAEVVSNAVGKIEGRRGGGSNRFSGVDYFSECYARMSKRDRVWYAILCSAGHRLDGETLLTFRLAVQSELKEIQAQIRRLTPQQWNDIGLVVWVDGRDARRRVRGTFYVE